MERSEHRKTEVDRILPVEVSRELVGIIAECIMNATTFSSQTGQEYSSGGREISANSRLHNNVHNR